VLGYSPGHLGHSGVFGSESCLLSASVSAVKLSSAGSQGAFLPERLPGETELRDRPGCKDGEVGPVVPLASYAVRLGLLKAE
jgi:hypothetical protein